MQLDSTLDVPTEGGEGSTLGGSTAGAALAGVSGRTADEGILGDGSAVQVGGGGNFGVGIRLSPRSPLVSQAQTAMASCLSGDVNLRGRL